MTLKRRTLKTTNNIGNFHRYIETELDPEYCTFEEAIKVKHYVENECWINTLNDFYGQEKNMKKMTRESILKLIDKTDGIQKPWCFNRRHGQCI